MAAVADKDGSGYYAQAAFIDLGEASTGGSSDNYAVVISDVVKDTRQDRYRLQDHCLERHGRDRNHHRRQRSKEPEQGCYLLLDWF